MVIRIETLFLTLKGMFLPIKIKCNFIYKVSVYVTVYIYSPCTGLIFYATSGLCAAQNAVKWLIKQPIFSFLYPCTLSQHTAV